MTQRRERGRSAPPFSDYYFWGDLYMSSKIEILAPCGSLDALNAAVRCGADAVYIGLRKFSARAYAENFGDDELEAAAAYCRLHGVKLHVAVNTLVRDDELEDALDAVKEAYTAGADAFIVQDIGLSALIKEMCPECELHASTQMSIHTPEGARFLYGKGFDRVVLAREMSFNEIAEVVRSCPVDTEVFVHGALCMCVSGQCYLSAMLGGRSGNRGRCAQPCRLPFTVPGGTGHDLSLKDNCIIDKLPELERLGVASAKIEGRMKRPEYVAAAVSACRTSADSGKADSEEILRLRSVFSRSGFTSGYYTGKLGREMFGTRSKDDVASASEKLLSQLRNLFKDERRDVPLDLAFTLKEGENARLTASARGRSVTVYGDIPQRAEKVALTEEKAFAQLSKTGGTPFFVKSFASEIGEGLTLPASLLNSLRREALEKLTALLSAPPKRTPCEVKPAKITPHISQGDKRFRAVFQSGNIPDCFTGCELVFIPLSEKPDVFKSLMQRGFSVGVHVPRIIFGAENNVKAKLEALKAAGITDVYCGNIGTASLCVKLGLTVHGGFSLNVFNSYSMDFFKKMGLADTEVSIELTAKQINRLGGELPRGIAAYGHLPLMITRNCPNRNGKGCKSCGGMSKITDRRGTEFTLMCSGGCTELLNGDALSIPDRLSAFENVDFFTLRFTYESYEECEKIYRLYETGGKPKGKYTGGLYFRGAE